jgi:hypothetical protein
MVENKKVWVTLFVLFLIVAGIRTYYALQTPYFSEDGAYFTLRQVENIASHGTPLYKDTLSYGGRTFLFLPIFHYILALFSKIFNPLIIAKVLPNIFASTIIFFVYLLVYNITKDSAVSVFTSLFSAFIPIYFSKTLNSISVSSIIVPLTVLLIYLFIEYNEPGKVNYFLAAMFLALLIHPSVILLIISFFVYITLLAIEEIPIKRSEVEIILFSAFLMVWLYLLIFKNAFLRHGFSFIWENIPTKYLVSYFHQISIWRAIYQIGIIPFFLSIFLIYYYLFNIKNKKVYLLISFAITTTALLWMKLVELELALIFLSVVMVILFGIAYHHLILYVNKTRFSKLEKPIFALICIIFVITAIIPSITLAKGAVAQSTTEEYASTLHKLGEITPENSRIASPLEEGHSITYFTGRKNFGDSNFLFLDNSDEVVSDIDELFTTISKIRANEILNKYKIDYVVFSPQSAAKYNLKIPLFVDNECFDKVIIPENEDMDPNTKVYKNRCVIVKNIIAKSMAHK